MKVVRIAESFKGRNLKILDVLDWQLAGGHIGAVYQDFAGAAKLSAAAILRPFSSRSLRRT